MTIEDWRKKIDETDSQILSLLNKRAEFAIEIGKIKRFMKIPIYNPERELIIINRLVSLNTGPLDESGVRKLFERIIDESRRIERRSTETNENL